MRAIVREIEYTSRRDHIDIVPLYDLHVGNAACDEKLLKKTIKKIEEDPACYWIGGGDMCDFINRKDPRHRESAMASWLWGVDDIARKSRDRVVEMLMPIKDKCLGLLKGNHEASFLKYNEVDVYAMLVDKIRPSHATPIMLGWQGFIVLKLVRVNGKSRASWPVRIYCHHGYGGGRLEGGHALTLGRLFKDYDCDIGLLGHRHVQMAIPRVQVAVSPRGKIYNREQLGVFCGSFLKSYSEDEVYSEERGLPALRTGAIRLRIWPDKQRIEVTL